MKKKRRPGPKAGGPPSAARPKRSPPKKSVRPARSKPAPPPRGGGATTGERLQKVLAGAGVASRRECELLIAEGRVEIDGSVVTELGVRVDPESQTIHVDGELLAKKRRVYFAVNKPEGVVSTARDPSGRMRVIDLIPPDAGRLFNVGRLDMASEGLILVTNDGELANQLTHPRHGVEKTYHVQVAGQPTAETLATLRKGVRLAEGKAHFVDAKIKSKKKNATVLEVVLDEGRNREIRRVLARVGHKVQRLTRVAVGPVRLADLPAGAYRPLTPAEVKKLRAAAEGSASEPPRRKRATKRNATPGRSTAKKKSPAATPGAAKPKRKLIGAAASSTGPIKKTAKPTKKTGKPPKKTTKRTKKR